MVVHVFLYHESSSEFPSFLSFRVQMSEISGQDTPMTRSYLHLHLGLDAKGAFSDNESRSAGMMSWWSFKFGYEDLMRISRETRNFHGISRGFHGMLMGF